jgi:flavin-dependent thymidylate synthase
VPEEKPVHYYPGGYVATTASIPDEPTVYDHAYISGPELKCIAIVGKDPMAAGGEFYECGLPAAAHADPGDASKEHLMHTHPHLFTPQPNEPTLCGFTASLTGETDPEMGGVWRTCGYPEQLHKWKEYDDYMKDTAGKVGAVTHTHGQHTEHTHTAEEYAAHQQPIDNERIVRGSALVRKADVAQYERQAMPDAARRGPVVTLIDAPVDPLGTLAVIGGIYTGQVARSKAEVTDDQRRAMLEDMQATVLNGPLECVTFTFLVEGVGRDITHQMVRNRFSFFAQESLRFAVAEDWAQEVPLPPSLASLPQDAPAVGIWRKALNGAEDAYAALIGAGMPAEEARKVLPHAITTRLYWTVSLRTLLQEAGKRTCTQAQFDWRQIFAGVAKALRSAGGSDYYMTDSNGDRDLRVDTWQYAAFADLLRPVCYQQGRCGFMAKFDRGCTIRERVDAFEKLGVPSTVWHSREAWADGAIDLREWAADPAAARVTEEQ